MPDLRTVQSYLLLSLAFSTVIFTHVAPTFADSAQLCKTDHGKTWYFSVGRLVFEREAPFPAASDPSTGIGDISPSEALIPPNPTAPIGCKGNPQQLKSYTTSGWPSFGPHNLFKDNFPGMGLNWPMVLWLLYHPSLTQIQDNPLNEMFYSAPLCKAFPFRKTFENGTFYCTNIKAGLDNPDAEFTGYEIAIPPKIYPLPIFPQRQIFRVSKMFDGYDVGYFLTEHVSLFYHAQYPSAPLNTLETKLIDFDTTLQNSLRDVEIKNYPWPHQTPQIGAAVP